MPDDNVVELSLAQDVGRALRARRQRLVQGTSPTFGQLQGL